MARFTEMSVTPAEPLGYGTAKLAFELDKVSSVLLAVFDTASYRDS